ncbi:MAG: sulfite exporter TauE/SafE family protein [Gammaproteobacteria bacterium]|nr:sulfite exporter TauE/SafE family protein [Gammaproteobacteria bacterium]MYD77247.1 sulfite exporter TauE/SafE family protein [Gammaproteobacteria bacterium]MYJ52407.1 sulfite exporter TauE/SafE family protein [Gammaproteobacteria bacterium]
MDLIFDYPLIPLYLFGVMVFAGVVHGGLGIGFPMIATPLIAVFVDVRLAILMTLLPTMAVNLASIAGGTDQIRSVKDYAPMFVGSLVGSVIGAWMLATMDPSPFRLALALLIFLYLWSTVNSPTPAPWISRDSKTVMCGFGLVAGISGGITNVMIAILIIYFLGLSMSRSKMVPILNICFLIAKLTQMAVLGMAGWFTLALVYQTVLPSVAALGGFWAGMKLSNRISNEIYRKMLHALLMILAVVLIGQFLIDLAADPA